jgi:nitronate monooxygenase
VFRQHTNKPINLNFFTHLVPEPILTVSRAGEPCFAPIMPSSALPSTMSSRAPFDDGSCAIVEEFKPEVVSFHFGLPEGRLLERVKATGCKVIASATTVREAKWPAERGCDAIIAQGCEARGATAVCGDPLALAAGKLQPVFGDH